MPCKGSRCQETWKQAVLYTTMLVLPSALLIVITLVDDKLFVHSSHTTRCPLGFFPCGNTSVCVAQEKQCDDYWDCENGEDEKHETCSDHRYGVVESIPKILSIELNLTALLEMSFKPTNTCDLPFYPAQCTCLRQTRISCKEKLDSLPTDIPLNVTHLLISHTGLAALPPSISALTELVTLVASYNDLTSITPYVLSGLRSLTRLYLTKNKLTILRNGTFHGLSSLRWLFLEHNMIRIIETGVFTNLSNLEVLLLHDNLLTLESPYQLHLPVNADTMINLELQGNLIPALTDGTIRAADSLLTLYLQNNKITRIEDGFFCPMEGLIDLNMTHNSITEFRQDMFPKKNRIKKLSIGHNPVALIEENTFSKFYNLVSLDLKGITLITVSPAMFENSPNLHYIYFKKFEYCRFAPMVRLCEPKGDGISSISNLLDLPVHRICIWVVAFFTCSGNIFVMVYRVVLRDERNIHSLFIKNLCAADFMMGLYLIIVASHDIMFRDQYNRHAYVWLSSWCCQATGFLAMLSCEVSIILVTFMSVERGIRIAFPYKIFNFNTQRASFSLACIWALGLLIAAIPVTSKEIFGTFYGSNGVCFPLHIHEPYLAGWEYSCFVFIGINFVSMIVIALCYIIMFVSIRNTRKKTTAPINMDVSFAKRFFLIVFTDAICWIPIIAIKLLAFANITISAQFYAWLTIFVLPINSAINPIVYSLTTTTFRRKFEDSVLSKWRSLTTRTSIIECSANPTRDTLVGEGRSSIKPCDACGMNSDVLRGVINAKDVQCGEEMTPLNCHTNGGGSFSYTQDNKISPLVVTLNMKKHGQSGVCDTSSI